MTLAIQNGTTLDVSLVVNGLLVGAFPASSGEEYLVIRPLGGTQDEANGP